MSPKAEQYLAKANECADFASMMSVSQRETNTRRSRTTMVQNG